MRLKLRIDLSEIHNPLIFREMWVPMGITFDQLHQLIQAAMGWENYHLYSFQEHPETRYFSVVSPFTEEFGIDGTEVIADSILFSNFNSNQMLSDNQPPDKLYYIYDFGDNWMHEFYVQEFDRNGTVPELVTGAGACPPEDCGGVQGFQFLKNHLSGKMSAEDYFDLFIAVNDDDFDVNEFDPELAQECIRRAWLEIATQM